METLTGKVTSVRGPFNDGWCILNVTLPGASDPATVVGSLSDFQPGDEVTFEGAYKSHPKYGRQFAAVNATLDIPRDVAGIRDYLNNGFRWIGPVLAGRLTDTFGDALFAVIENEPEKLASIPGLTSERARQIHQEYMRVKSDREDDLWFSRHHITLSTKSRLIDAYGSKKEAIARIRQNPYLLSEEVWGIGFKKADAIALSIGIPRDSAVRAGACLRYCLSQAASEGHCYLPEPDLAARVLEMLGSNDHALIRNAISDGISSEKLTALSCGSETHIYPTSLYGAEIAIAAKLRVLAASHHAEMISELSSAQIGALDPDQAKTLALAMSSKILIITGGPGVGKTYTINAVIRALGERKIELAAPTGKAAKRMSELAGREAQTLHRLLEYSPQSGGFSRNLDNPIECDTLIVDETSMVDVPLMASLLEAIPTHTQLIFVGDVDQLPSVGPGCVLRDMIDSGILPVCRLNTLHRQAAKSLINQNAQAIRSGGKPTLSQEGDFWFIAEESAENLPEQICRIIEAVSRRFFFLNGSLELLHPCESFSTLPDPAQPLRFCDIQVLCPQRRGPAGVENLNRVLRPLLNPSGSQLSGTSFLLGDRVIQTKNNYNLEIYNGDIGVISGVGRNCLFVDFEDLKGTRSVEYPKEDLKDLQLAYALTIHKSQGSEFPVVIIPIHTTNYMMLQRNLIYTGITRGKKLVVLVGTTKALNLAIKNVDSTQRYSNIGKWLKSLTPPQPCSQTCGL